MIATTKAKINVWWTSIYFFLLRYYASTLCYFYLSYVQLIKKDLLTIQKNKKILKKCMLTEYQHFDFRTYSYKVTYYNSSIIVIHKIKKSKTLYLTPLIWMTLVQWQLWYHQLQIWHLYPNNWLTHQDLMIVMVLLDYHLSYHYYYQSAPPQY